MKKLKIIIILAIVFLSYNITKDEYVMLELPLLGKTIYVDAGHGGIDPGAVYKDINEKDINLKIALKLEEILTKKGAIVYMIRESDHDLASPNAYYRKRSDLGNRAYIINNTNPDLYLSIHLNADTSSSWSGAQTFYTNKNEKSKIIAQIIQEDLKDHLLTKREAKEIKNMYMYDKINVPGILLEAGFISNHNERFKLLTSDYQNEIAIVITNSIVKYFTFGV